MGAVGLGAVGKKLLGIGIAIILICTGVGLYFILTQEPTIVREKITDASKPTYVEGPGKVSITIPQNAVSSGTTVTIQKLDPASAPELPEWSQKVISLYNFTIDSPINGSVAIRLPLPDVELAVLGHYVKGGWEIMPFTVEDNMAVVEVKELSLFSWLDFKVSWLSDKIVDFLTLRWAERKVLPTSTPYIKINENDSLGLIGGSAQFISDNKWRIFVQNKAPIHLDIYPLTGKVIELKRTSIWASVESDYGMVVAPRDIGEWVVELQPNETVTFEAYFSDSAVVALFGDLIPLGRFSRAIWECVLFARNGREMGWGDVKNFLVIPAVAEAVKKIEEIQEMPILEKGRITYQRLLKAIGIACIGDFSVDLSRIERQEKVATLWFIITKIASTDSEVSSRELFLKDDHGNIYSAQLDLIPTSVPSSFLNLLPIGFTYTKAINVSIPKVAPIVSIKIGEAEEISVEKLRFTEPTFVSEFGAFLLKPQEPTTIGKFLLATASGISPDLHTWSIPIVVENKDYIERVASLQVAVQYEDGRIIATPKSAQTLSIPGLSKKEVFLPILPLYGNGVPQIRTLLIFYGNASGTYSILKLWPVSSKDLPPRVGQGLGDKEDLFIDAYQRNGGRKMMGDPLSLPHWFAGGEIPKDEYDVLIQEFPEVSEFGKSVIIWDKQHNATKAYVINGVVLEKYLSLGGPYFKSKAQNIYLGVPTSDVKITNSVFNTTGSYATFSGGAIVSFPGYTSTVLGKIYEKWMENKGAIGPLGFPLGDEQPTAPSGAQGFNTTGWVQEFEGGHIYYHSTGRYSGQAFEIHGVIDTKYTSIGGTSSWLGFPVSDIKSEYYSGRIIEFEIGYAFRTRTGQYEIFPAKRPEWMYKIPNQETVDMSHGIVYLTGPSGVHALSGESGKILWSFEATSPCYLKVADDVVLVTVGKSTLYALDSKTGQMKWRLSIENLLWKPSVTSDTVFVGSDNMQVAIDLISGEIKWKSPYRGEYSGIPTAHNNTVYVSYGWKHWLGWSAEVDLTAIDSSNGLIRWRITRERETYLPGVEFNYYWPVWTDGKLVYWYSDLHDDLSALDPNTGELRWRFNLTEELKAFAFDGEKCFIVTSSRVYALDKSSGQIKWVYVHAGFRMVYGTATLVNNLLYVSTEDEIIGLDVTTGTPVWSFPAQGGAMVDVADNIAYLCTSEYVLAVKIK